MPLNGRLKTPWAEKDGIAIAMIPKAGSTSFRNTLNIRQSLTPTEASRFSTRVLFIREPFDRLVSSYSFFHYLNETRQNGHGGGHYPVPNDATHNGYEAWVDFILETPNPHWMPQIDLTGNIHTIAHRFDSDNLNKYWKNYWPGRLPDWLNATSHLSSTDYRTDDIALFYKDDIDLYNSVSVI